MALNALELAVNAALSAPPSANAGAAAAAAATVTVTVDAVKQALQKTHVLCECRLLRPCLIQLYRSTRPLTWLRVAS